jgi:hypothetical protein
MVIAATRADAITTTMPAAAPEMITTAITTATAMPAAAVKTTATCVASSTMATATITRQASCRKQNSKH